MYLSAAALADASCQPPRSSVLVEFACEIEQRARATTTATPAGARLMRYPITPLREADAT
jgi:hypothetical protein